MIELAYFAVLHRILNWGCAPIFAARTVAADPATVRALVGAQPNLDGLVAGTGVRAELLPTASQRLVSARVVRGRRELLWLTWILSPKRGTTEVDLALQIESRGLFTRLALFLGGRRWLRHRLEAALDALARQAARAVEEIDEAATPATRPRAGRRAPARRHVSARRAAVLRDGPPHPPRRA